MENDSNPDQKSMDDRKTKMLALVELATDMVIEGKPASEIKAVLVSKGMDEVTANELVNLIFERRNEAKRMNRIRSSDDGNSNILYGALWCAGGLIVYFYTHKMAEGGGVYVIPYGAIIIGGLQFIIGILQKFFN